MKQGAKGAKSSLACTNVIFDSGIEGIKVFFLTIMIWFGLLAGCGISGNGGSNKTSDKTVSSGLGLEAAGKKTFVTKTKKNLPDITADHACRTDVIQIDGEEGEAFQAYLDTHPVTYRFEEYYELPERTLEYEQIGFSFLTEFSEKEIYVHETMHLLQLECPCVYEDNGQLSADFGPFRQNRDVEVNPLYESWMLEALAEKNACAYLDREPFTYINMIYYLDSITLTQLVREDFKVQDIMDMGFLRNMEELYDCLKATTQQEKKEVLKMLYNIQIMQDCPKGFEEIYLENKGIEEMTNEERDNMRLLVKAEACQSYSRFFYRNLVQILEKKGIPLCDIFYLMKIYEMDLNYHVGYREEDKQSYNQELIENYVELRNQVLGLVANHLGVEKEEIGKEYEAYADKWVDENGDTRKNYDLSWMTEEKRDFIQYMIEEHGEYAYASFAWAGDEE